MSDSSSWETMNVNTGLTDSSGQSIIFKVSYDPSTTDPNTLGILPFTSPDSQDISTSELSQVLSNLGVSQEEKEGILSNLSQESSSVSYERFSEILTESGVPQERQLGILLNMSYSSDSSEFSTSTVAGDSTLPTYSSPLEQLNHYEFVPFMFVALFVSVAVMFFRDLALRRVVDSPGWSLSRQNTKPFIDLIDY